jgi:hypothetical protein
VRIHAKIYKRMLKIWKSKDKQRPKERGADVAHRIPFERSEADQHREELCQARLLKFDAARIQEYMHHAYKILKETRHASSL